MKVDPRHQRQNPSTPTIPLTSPQSRHLTPHPQKRRREKSLRRRQAQPSQLGEICPRSKRDKILYKAAELPFLWPAARSAGERDDDRGKGAKPFPRSKGGEVMRATGHLPLLRWRSRATHRRNSPLRTATEAFMLHHFRQPPRSRHPDHPAWNFPSPSPPGKWLWP